jgi:uracil-DNA glycosylase
VTNIVIVGEAWGEAEERARTPFVGAAGYELTRMLEEAGIRRADCFLTNVFNLRPGPKNDIETLCCNATGDRLQGWPALRAGKYIRAEYGSELERLYHEIGGVNPNLVIALGNTASWAVLRNAGISKIRGAVASSGIIGRSNLQNPSHLPPRRRPPAVGPPTRNRTRFDEGAAGVGVPGDPPAAEDGLHRTRTA